MAQSIQLLNPIKVPKVNPSSNTKNTYQTKPDDYLKIRPNVGGLRKSINNQSRILKQSSNPRTASEDDHSDKHFTRPASRNKNVKLRKKNTSQNLSMSSFKIDKITQALETSRDREMESTKKLEFKEESRHSKFYKSKFSENKSVIRIDNRQNTQTNSKYEDSLDNN